MAYILSLFTPGLGHLASRRWFAGLFLVMLWLLGHSAVWIAMSFEVWALLAFPIFQLLLAVITCIDLYRVRKKSNDPKHRPGCLFSLLFSPIAPVLGVIAVLFVTSTVVRPVRIRSGSMTPSVVTGDVILVQIFAPRLWSIRLGDIVLVAHPQHSNRLLIKRVIGVGGDVITIRGGNLQRNGRTLSQCELRSLNDHETGQRVHERLEVLNRRPYLVWDQPAIRSTALTRTVPADHIFVVGDNRDRSGDSRSFGPVPLSSVRGLVTARIFPVLTNEVYQAPLGARRAAFQRCSRPGNNSSNNSRAR